MKSSSFDVFNHHMNTYKVYTGKPFQMYNVGNNARVAYNGVVRSQRDYYGFSLDDVKQLITFAFAFHEGDVADLSAIQRLFVLYGKKFEQWREDYRYEIRRDGFLAVLRRTKPATITDDMFNNIEEAFTL